MSDRPPSFALDLIDDWLPWILEHGLPELPERVELGETVPIAWWTDGEIAVLRTLSQFERGEGSDDLQFYELVDGEWQAGFSGGSGWDCEFVEVASAGGSGITAAPVGGGMAVAVGDLVPDGARVVEIDREGERVRHPLVPGPYWLAVWRAPYQDTVVTTVRLLDDGGGAIWSDRYGPVA